MTAGRRILRNAWRLPALMLAALLVAACFIALDAPPASAQEGSGLRPWLRNLFEPPRRSERLEPGAMPGEKAKPKKKAARKPFKPAEPKIVEIEKSPDARVVLVIGDFLGAGLAEGLKQAYAQNPAVRVVDRSRGSSGFVREDVFNWPAEIKAMVEAEKPAAIVVMLGSNDRQQMRVADTREPPRSPAWNDEYGRRTGALGKALAETGVPYLWVGLPAFKSPKMTQDMLAFNDIYRAAAEAARGEFVDIWDGFVDENGAFVTTGPDINGQPVRLRAGDGINLTAPGKRKLAFYVEKPLAKIVGGAVASDGILVPASLPPAGPGETAPRIDTGVPISLNDPELDGGSELLGGNLGGKTPGEKLVTEGIAPPPAPGRADDFAWPQRQPPVAAGGVPGSTTAIAP